MRVTFVITSLGVGGAEMMLYKLISRLSSSFEPSVVTLSRVGEIAEKIRKLGVPVVNVGMNALQPNPMQLLKLMQHLKTFEPQLVQTWLYHADLLGTIAALIAKVRRISWNIRCSALDPGQSPLATRFIVRLLARMSHIPQVVITNSLEGRHAHECLGYKPKRWEFIPNGFDTEEFRPNSQNRAEFRRALGLKENDVVFGIVARYHPMKDHAGALHAAARVATVNPNVHVVLVGNGVDARNAKLQRLVRDFGLSGRIHLLGESRDVPLVMAGLDCLMSSAAWGEGFPNVVGEAMACGVPCIVTDVGDSAEVVGETGWVVPPRNPQALADAMRAFLALAVNQRREFGHAARTNIEKKYSLGAIVKRYELLFQSLCE